MRIDMKLEIGDWILLEGISRHGKNRIAQHGDVWNVIETDGACPGISVRSKNRTFNTGGSGDNKWIHDGRWIDPNDFDFKIVKKLDFHP